MDSNKPARILQAILALLACITIALTLYSCTRFYAYLPTSDIWIYTDFLASAARGALLIDELFVKHNGAHLIALPKLVYFLDMWLVQGKGVLVVLVSLLSLLSTTMLFLHVIYKTPAIDSQRKTILALMAIIFLLSACQVESLLNPANLQWSLLVFSATVTAWFAWRFVLDNSSIHFAGMLFGVLLVSLTSASVWLIVWPLAALLAAFRFGRIIVLRWLTWAAMTGLVLLVGGEIIRLNYWPDRLPVLAWAASELVGLEMNAETRQGIIDLFNEVPLRAHLDWFLMWLHFCADFFAPAIERLHFLPLTILAGCVVVSALLLLSRTERAAPQHSGVFFGLLLVFALVTVAATGLVRSYNPTAFTFRFVNIGQLFGASMVSLLCLQITDNRRYSWLVLPLATAYLLVLSWVNVTEANAFGYGRNHIRLNQVAYSLDIKDPFVVSAMPGTIWEQQDYETVEANKHKLRETQSGIYGSDAWQQAGKPVGDLSALKRVSCHTEIVKQRQLLPDAPAYRLQGESRSTADGNLLTRAYFVDAQGIIRGYGIPVMASRDITESWLQQTQWAGFANLDSTSTNNTLAVYAYNDRVICEPALVELPVYEAPRKKATPRATH